MWYLKDSFMNYIYLFLLFGFVEVILYLYYKKRNIKINVGFIVGYQLLICLIITILTITGISDINDFNIQNMKSMNTIFYLENIFSYECVMNMIMFIPIGIIIPLLWKNARRFDIVIFSGFCFSLLIELSQLFNFRASDINDILTNTIGTIIGYLIYKIVLRGIHCFELSDKNKLMRYHSFFQIIIIFVVYFLFGSPIISLIHSF